MNTKDMRAPPPAYAVLYPNLVQIARAHGYALAIHGSMTRDMDLIAVPWTTEAGPAFPMIDEMRAAVQGVFSHHEVDDLLVEGNGSDKPHGRRTYCIHLTNEGCAGPYLDVSVMPRQGIPNE